jgi:hypothetical protein
LNPVIFLNPILSFSGFFTRFYLNFETFLLLSITNFIPHTKNFDFEICTLMRSCVLLIKYCEIFQSTQSGQQTLVCKMCFYHQHVSIAISTTTGVTYKNIRNPNNLSQCISEPFSSTQKVSKFPYYHWIMCELKYSFNARICNIFNIVRFTSFMKLSSWLLHASMKSNALLFN